MVLETDEAEYERIRQKGWHKAFAWLPVKVTDYEAVWLEHYERKLVGWNRNTLQWITRKIED